MHISKIRLPAWDLKKAGVLSLQAAAVVVLTFACLLRFIWISDIPYIADEPNLILSAMELNANGAWAEKGLQGAKGVHYGPLPTWIYQLGVASVSSPTELALLKAIVITAITLFCLWVWSRGLRKSESQLVWLAVVSPFLWFYARDLWDNSLAVAFSLALWTSYLHFDQRPALRRLVLPVVLASSLFLIHLMSTPILAAVAVHFAIKHRAWIRRRWAGVLVLAVLAVAIDARYILQLMAIPSSPQQGAWTLKSLVFVLKAPGYFSSWGMSYFLGNGWMRVPLFPQWTQIAIGIASGFTLFVYGFFFVGLWLATRRPGRFIGLNKQVTKNEGVSWQTESDALALMTLAFFTALSYAKGLSEHPHYFNAIWPAVFYLVWRGMAFLWSAPAWKEQGFGWVGKAAVGTWALAVVLVLASLTARLHWTEGTRTLHYGPTLGNLWDVSDLLSRADGARIVPVAFHTRFFPQALASLIEWRKRTGQVGSGDGLVGTWLLTYRNPKENWNGAIVLAPFAPDETNR